MNYWKYTIACAPELTEILIAYLSDGPFESFVETEFGFEAYVATPSPPPAGRGATPHDALGFTKSDNISPDNKSELPKSPNPKVNRGVGVGVEEQLTQLQQKFQFNWTKEFLPHQNWNKIWESNFQPVIVEDFCAVRADFHEPITGVEQELVINPKMAFGTGHHETTWMCLRALRALPCQNARLLDFGCGTGVLAILAARLGATEVEAVDIEEESYRNTLENSAANGVAERIIARCGTLDAVQGGDFDGILANINRNVILDSLPRLRELLKPGGWLLISGILDQDGELVFDAAKASGFELKTREQRGYWLAAVFVR